ncbi:MAG: hypothetical protein WCG16_08335 [Methylococcales bacterium]
MNQHHISSVNKLSGLGSLPITCNRCRDLDELDFDFSFAYQPIVNFHAKNIFAHEALVRGINGESAFSILAKVNDDNLYRFDQSCRVKSNRISSSTGYERIVVD